MALPVRCRSNYQKGTNGREDGHERFDHHRDPNGFDTAVECPPTDSDPMQLLRIKQEQDPPKLSDRDGLPDDLSALADGLLRREPGLRLMSAATGEILGLDCL